MKPTYRDILQSIPSCFYKASYTIDPYKLYNREWMTFRTRAEADYRKEQDSNFKDYARKTVLRELFSKIVDTAPTEVIEQTEGWGIKLSAMAVIMSEKEFNDVVIQAYEQGQKDGFEYKRSSENPRWGDEDKVSEFVKDPHVDDFKARMYQQYGYTFK